MPREPKRDRAQTLYIVFYLLDIALDFGVYLLCRFFNFAVSLSTLTAWAVSVLSSYFAARRFITGAGGKGFRAFVTDLSAYFGSRIFAGLLDLVCMMVTADFLRLPELPIKPVAFAAPMLIKNLFDFIVSRRSRKKRRKKNSGAPE